MILVTGFGSFRDVVDNPAARAARAVHGCRVVGETVVGRVIPVSYARGPDETLALARALRPRLVVGLGVAVQRSRVEVERVARSGVEGADVDGVVADSLGEKPQLAATLDVDGLAEALGAGLSEDAGRYVCNAWLYRVTSALKGTPVGFVHLPPEGIGRDRLLQGLASLT